MSKKPLGLIALTAFLVLMSACQNSWIRVQNVSDSPANVTVRYLDESGKTITESTRTLAPGAADNFPMSGNDGLPHGYRGSALIESDRPVVALRRTDQSGDSADIMDGDTISATASGSKLYLPLVMSHAAPWDTWNSRFNVQNVSDSVASCITLTYISLDTGAEIAWDPYKPGAKNPPKQQGCPNGGRLLAAADTLSWDQDSFGVPAGFAGSVRIDASVSGTSKTDQPAIAATVDSKNGPFNLLTSYRALTTGDLGTSVLLPVIEREVGPDASYNSYFQMQAGNATQPVQVQLHIEGVDANGNHVSKNNAFTFTGARRCEQANNEAANCLAPGDALPFGFTGYATLSASSPIGVVVQRGSYFGAFGSYRGMVPSMASTRVALPAVNSGGWIRILPADGGGANVNVRYIGFGEDGVVGQSPVIGVNGSTTLFQSDEPSLPPGFDGSAIIESDRPIVAVVSYDTGGGDSGMLYDGVAIP